MRRCADPRTDRRTDRGSATLWMLGLATLISAISMVAVVRGSAVLYRHRLEAAADLSALAGAAEIGRSAQDPCQAAARIADANGVRLDHCTTELDIAGRSGTVAVELSALVDLPLVGNRIIQARARAGRVKSTALRDPTARAGRDPPGNRAAQCNRALSTGPLPGPEAVEGHRGERVC